MKKASRYNMSKWERENKKSPGKGVFNNTPSIKKAQVALRIGCVEPVDE